MSIRVETEDITSTKGEKFLAVVLAAFVLIGSGWLYWKAYDWVGPDKAYSYSAAENKIIDQAANADQEYYLTLETHDKNTEDLNQARADLNLAVDRGESTAVLERQYREAQTAVKLSREQLTKAEEVRDRTAAAAGKVEALHQKIEKENANSWRHWLVAGLRLVFIGGMLLGSLLWTQRLRARESRYVPIGFALTASATILAFVFLVDYITDYIDILELGPIVLSLMGIAATIGAFALLQKYLAKRTTRTRVRKGECPFCAFPVRPDQAHCEGCGRAAVAECATCNHARRVGTPHCASCGAE
ncbi:MAG: hypothetical protein GX678_05555 [Actinomycetales bacterium]|nr:hypothetical protein [Actinomycetales bacterium]